MSATSQKGAAAKAFGHKIDPPEPVDSSKETPSLCVRCPLKGNGFCSALPPPARSALRSKASDRQYRAGDIIGKAGDPEFDLVVVLSGASGQRHILADGRQSLVRLALPGQFVSFGNKGSVLKHDIEALSPTRVCRIAQDDFVALRTRYPELMHRIHDCTVKEIDDLTQRWPILARGRPIEKLAQFLLSLRNKSENPDLSLVELPLSRQDLADYFGMQIETVSRTFTLCRDQGIIEMLTPRRLMVRDWSILAWLAEGHNSPTGL